MNMPPFFTSPSGKSYLSASIALLFTAFFLMTGLACYESNDDMAMIGILSGAQGLTASPDAIFLSLPLGTLLYWLYKAAPSFPWYGIVMYTALAIGCAVGLRVIADAPTAMRNKIFSAVAFLGLYMQMVMYLNFTSVSLLLWFCVGARVAQLCLSDHDRLPIFWGYGLLLGLSYLIRPSIIWTVALAFCLPVAVALWSVPKKKWVAALLLPLALTMAIATAW
ncbi:MAG: hypothetical protein PHH58_08365, partial [Rhodoferax sp.]|nr:hypothetical protein [Rhodoferax sp.]